MKKKFSVLIVDDEQDMREGLSDLLETRGYSVKLAENGRKALDIYKNQSVDCILTDIDMPEMNGMDLLKSVLKENPDEAVIIMTGYSSIQGAVEAIKLGAKDYFTKPFNINEIEKVIENVYNKKQLLEQNKKLKQEILRQKNCDIIGESLEIRTLHKEIIQLSASDISVLITGESGTGKELVAKAIHKQSNRSAEPFVPINCAAIPADLLESELFGYEKGSFSGAIKLKYGLFEVANKGTLFLDEIGEMPMVLQSKLLRVVEDRKIRRIGSTKEIEIDIRIVSSTNRDIKKEIEEKNFRNDLYFRLATYNIITPSLRDHVSDIPLLIAKLLKRKQKEDYVVSQDVYSAFGSYDWPGNVRELENVLERMVLFTTGKQLEIGNVPNEILNTYNIQPEVKDSSSLVSIKMDDIEKEHILNILDQCGGDKVKTAELLGIGLKTLYRKLSKYSE